MTNPDIAKQPLIALDARRTGALSFLAYTDALARFVFHVSRVPVVGRPSSRFTSISFLAHADAVANRFGGLGRERGDHKRGVAHALACSKAVEVDHSDP